MALRTFFLLLLVTSLSGAKWPDGAWNGKPFPKAELVARAKAGNKNALAELAYCQLYGYYDLKFEKKQIFERARRAHLAGSLLGTAVLSECARQGIGQERNRDKAIALLTGAFGANAHPYLQARYASLTSMTAGGAYNSKEEEAFEILTKAVAQGSLYARWMVARRQRDEAVAAHSIEDYVTGMIALAEDPHGLPLAADEIIWLHNSRSYRLASARKKLPPALVKKCREKVRDLAARQHPFPRYRVLDRMIQEGNLHEAMPQIVAFSRDHYLGHHLLIEIADSYEKHRPKGSSYPALTMDESHLTYAVREAHRLGSTWNFVLQRVASAYIYHSDQRIEDWEKGLSAWRQILHKEGQGHCRVSHALSNALIRRYFNEWRRKGKVIPETEKWHRQGIHHLYLHSRCPVSRYWLYEVYTRDTPFRDLTKAYALHLAEMDYETRYDHLNAQKKPRTEFFKKHLTPEIEREAKKLVSQGYPRADRFREPAFYALQKLGDFPKDDFFVPLDPDRDGRKPGQGL